VIYSDAWQLEAKTYATSYVRTTTVQVTRNAETLTLPTTGLTPTQGTIAAWVYVNSVARRQTGTTNRVFDVQRNGGGNAILVGHSGSTANWTLTTANDAGATSAVTVADSLTPDGWHRFVVTWAASQAKIFIDGVVRGTINTPNLPTAFAATISLGSNASSLWLNTYFDNVVLDTVVWSDAQVAADYASNAPYAPTATTTAVVNFDGSLVGENYVIPANFDWNGGGRWNA
jgi:hypothetical protein